MDLALQNLWKRFFEFLINKNHSDFHTIFAHNLGEFDGYFIYKALSIFSTDTNPLYVKTKIDPHNKFIIIDYKDSNSGVKFTFKDSLRIFPVSLNNLCKVFGVEGKLGEYKGVYNNIDIFNNFNDLNELLQYNKQDCISLHKALNVAQLAYFMNYNVDITTIV